MKIVVGLGNPGEENKNTRHNLGFMVLDELQKQEVRSKKQEVSFKYEKKFNAEICKVNNDLLLVKPQTYMNDSGKTVSKLLSFYKITNFKDLIVVHDDLDLELGKVKFQDGGQSAGHHGIESIMAQTGKSDFLRIRVGIGRPKREEDQSCYYDVTKNYLLTRFTDDEKKLLLKVIDEAKLTILKLC